MKKTTLVSMVAVLGLVACAKSFTGDTLTAPIKKNASNNEKDAQKRAQAAMRKAPNGASIQSATKSYDGKNLILLSDKKAKFGWIQIKGDEAKLLFQALPMVGLKTEANELYLAGKAKEGKSLRCTEEAQVATPTIMEYNCSVYIEPVTGTADEIAAVVSEDNTVAMLTERSNGKNLSLGIPFALSGMIKLDGKDAEALYSTLAATAKPSKSLSEDYNASVKVGTNILCYSQVAKSDAAKIVYNCNMMFNLKTGQMTTIDQTAATLAQAPVSEQAPVETTTTTVPAATVDESTTTTTTLAAAPEAETTTTSLPAAPAAPAVQ